MAANKDALLVKEARKKLERNPALTSDVNANRIFKEYQDLKLIPKKYKVKEHFLNAVSKVAREKNLTAKKAADYLVKINKLENRSRFNPEAADWIINKVKYEGIPLELDSKGKARFATRRFHEKPPKQLQDFVKKLEKNKNLPHGTWEKFTRYAKESWEEAGEKNRKLFEKTGILFDRGHLNESKSGGPNVGMNQRSERALGPGGNRSKGATPNFKTPDIPKYIGVPDKWSEAFTEYLLKKEGLSATGLRIGEELSSGDLALIEQGAHPDVVVARRKAKYDAERPSIKESLPESHLKIVEQQKGARSRVQVDKNIRKQNQKILGIVPKVKKVAKAASLLTIGSLAGLSALGTAASAADTKQRWDKAKQTGNPLDYVQSGLSAASTATGWSGIGEVVATPADIANLYIDGLRSKRNAQMSTEERRRAIDSLKFIK